MGLSTCVATVPDMNSCWFDGKMMHYHGTIAISASTDTYPTGGLTLSLVLPLIKSTRLPQFVKVWGQSKQSGQTQYDYSYVPGTTLANGVLKIFTGGAEVSAGATPSGVSGDKIEFEAVFLGQN